MLQSHLCTNPEIQNFPCGFRKLILVETITQHGIIDDMEMLRISSTGETLEQSKKQLSPSNIGQITHVKRSTNRKKKNIEKYVQSYQH